MVMAEKKVELVEKTGSFIFTQNRAHGEGVLVIKQGDNKIRKKFTGPRSWEKAYNFLSKNNKELDNFDVNFIQSIRNSIKDKNPQGKFRGRDQVNNFKIEEEISFTEYKPHKVTESLMPEELREETLRGKVAQKTVPAETVQEEARRQSTIQISEPTKAWLEEQGINPEKVIKAREILNRTSEKVNVKTKGTNLEEVLQNIKDEDTANSIQKDLQELELDNKELVAALFLFKLSNGQWAMNKGTIKSYHATLHGKEATEEAYAIWEAQKKGEDKIGVQSFVKTVETVENGVESVSGKKDEKEKESPTETQQAEGEVEKEKQKEIEIKIQEAELKEFSEFVTKLNLDADTYQEAALTFMADSISDGKKDKTREFLEKLKKDPNAIKHANALAREYEANILINVAKNTEFIGEPVEIAPQVTGNIDWSNFSEENIDHILNMTEPEIISNKNNILSIDSKFLETLIYRDREENEGRIIKILSENLSG